MHKYFSLEIICSFISYHLSQKTQSHSAFRISLFSVYFTLSWPPSISLFKLNKWIPPQKPDISLKQLFSGWLVFTASQVFLLVRNYCYMSLSLFLGGGEGKQSHSTLWQRKPSILLISVLGNCSYTYVLDIVMSVKEKWILSHLICCASMLLLVCSLD